jgi:hypothetical protein
MSKRSISNAFGDKTIVSERKRRHRDTLDNIKFPSTTSSSSSSFNEEEEDDSSSISIGSQISSTTNSSSSHESEETEDPSLVHWSYSNSSSRQESDDDDEENNNDDDDDDDDDDDESSDVDKELIKTNKAILTKIPKWFKDGEDVELIGRCISKEGSIEEVNKANEEKEGFSVKLSAIKNLTMITKVKRPYGSIEQELYNDNFVLLQKISSNCELVSAIIQNVKTGKRLMIGIQFMDGWYDDECEERRLKYFSQEEQPSTKTTQNALAVKEFSK